MKFIDKIVKGVREILGPDAELERPGATKRRKPYLPR